MMNGKSMNEVASFVEDAKKGLLISSHLTLDTTPDVFISLIAPSKKTGIYSIDDNKKAGVLQINQKAYQIRGTINLKVNKDGNVANPKVAVTGSFETNSIFKY